MSTQEQTLRRLVQRRRRLVLSAAFFALSFYMLQVALSVFTTVLDGFAFGPFTWGWVFAIAQFVVPLVILHIYLRRSAALEARAHIEAQRDV